MKRLSPLTLASQMLHPGADGPALVVRLCVRLLLKRGAAAPSSL